jgi:hypothetical protein
LQDLVSILNLAGYLNIFLGCDAKMSGFMDIWNNIDAYILNVDQQLCTQNCPCHLNNTFPFTNNPSYAPYFNQWVITDQVYGATAFQDCPVDVKRSAYSNAIALDPQFDPNGNFNTQNFADYMSRVEKEFSCAGWCRTSYVNGNTGQEMILSKYLFSNINRGPPSNRGCFYAYINWVVPYLLAWGSVVMVLVGFMIIMFVMLLLLRNARKDERGQKPEEIYVVEDKGQNHEGGFRMVEDRNIVVS